MDKSWIKEDRKTLAYEMGVENFLIYAEANAETRKIPCPCRRCLNLGKKKSINVVRGHLYSNGFSWGYTDWIWHGEHVYSSSSNAHSHVGVCTDAALGSETVDMCQAAYRNDDYDEQSLEFEKFVEEAERPLFDENEHTRLEALVELQNLKAKFGLSDTCFSEMLTTVGKLLPNENTLPKTLYEAKKTIGKVGLEYEKIHACPNDCVLYRGNVLSSATSCPKCGASRWKLNKDGNVKINQPSKVVWYFPIISRFKRLFRSAKTAEMLTWHDEKRTKDGHMRHPADSPAWKLVDYKWPEFASEPRNLRLALSADGINPHSNLSNRYSCWPIILVTYNLPPWLCMKRKYMMLSLLIFGPKQPGNGIDVYLQPLIENLCTLWDGVDSVYDAYRKDIFTLRAVLLWTINDFPAYGNLSGCTTKGYKACPICSGKTEAVYLNDSRKVVYLCHRKYLERYHPYRRQKKSFNNEQEFGVAPRPQTGEEVLRIVENIENDFGKEKKKGKSKKGKQKKGKEKNVADNVDLPEGWNKRSIFFDLVYWKSLHIRHCLDVMHIEKNVCESLVGTLLNIPSRTKDSVAARLDMVDMGVRLDLAPKIREKRTFLPPAPYTLSRVEKIKMLSSLLLMKVPDGHSSNIKNLVSMDDLKLFGLKYHDCHILMQQLLPVAIRSVLPRHVRISIMRLCFFFNALCTKVIDVSKLDKLQSDVVLTLYELEKIFPPSFFDIMIHLTVHLVREVRLCGPVFYRWMYPFERFMKVLKGYVRNRFHPEGCIAESYIGEESIEFCSQFLEGCRSVGVGKGRSKHCGPLSGAKCKSITEDERNEAHLHVLSNNAEVDPYKEIHKRIVEDLWAGKKKSKKWLQDEHNRTFADWFQTKVSEEIEERPETISDTLKWLAGKPSYTVWTYEGYQYGGVKYFTQKRDNERVVQNSGVTLVAKTMQLSSAKDKYPVECDMTFYGVIEEIWELDYQDFNAPLFLCRWVENQRGIKVDEFGFTLVKISSRGHKKDKFTSAGQVNQVFYVEDPLDSNWSVVLTTPNRDYRDCFYDDGLGDIAPFCVKIPLLSDEAEIEDDTTYMRENVEGVLRHNDTKEEEDEVYKGEKTKNAPDPLQDEAFQAQVTEAVQEITEPLSAGAITTTESGKTRGKRGVVHMHVVKMRKGQGKKVKVSYDEDGNPCGKPRHTLQSYIGMLAREKIPITSESWHAVPGAEKEKIWLDVKDTFKIAPESRKKVLSSATNKFRQFKTFLTNKHVLPNLGQKKFCEDDLLEKAERGEFQICGSDDVLSQVLQTPEHSGRVRGVGGNVNPTIYFNLPKERKIGMTKPELLARDARRERELEDTRKHFAEEQAKCNEAYAKKFAQLEACLLEKYGLSSPPAMVSPSTPLSDKGSNHDKDVQRTLHFKDDKQNAKEDCRLVPNPTQQDGMCKLAVDDINNIVAFGTVFDGDRMSTMIHGVPMKEGCVRVAVIGVEKGDALLPVPVEGEMEYVHQAVGSHVAWPEEFVIRTQPFKKTEKRKKEKTPFELVKRHPLVPEKCNLLYKHAKVSMAQTRKAISEELGFEVFGHEAAQGLTLLANDITQLLELQWLGCGVIKAYMAYLYGLVEQKQELDVYAFTDPGATFSPEKGQVYGYLLNLLREGNSNRIYFIPYNSGAHWVLTIIREGEIYFLDPLKRSLARYYKKWESTVLSVVKDLNAERGKLCKGLKMIPLEGCPTQPGGVECGYYVMRYMRDIINNETLSFDTKWAACKRTSYTQAEIDEV